jgi:hypothetical protein
MIDIDKEPLRYAILAGAIGPTVSGGDWVRYEDYISLIAEVRRLRTYEQMARMQVYELMGIEVDIEQFGREFDDVCMATLKRVMGVLGGKP